MGSIVLSGPDGSGKTTLARYLRSYLYSKGIYASYTWYRGSHLAASLLARVLSKTRTMRGHENPYYGLRVPERLKPLWLLIEFASILPHYLVRRALSMSGIVIGDRGVLDFIVWICITLDHKTLLRSTIGRFLIRIAGRENIVLVTAEPGEAIKRVRDMPRETLLREHIYYRALSKHYAKAVIDTTNKHPYEAMQEILLKYSLKTKHLQHSSKNNRSP